MGLMLLKNLRGVFEGLVDYFPLFFVMCCGEAVALVMFFIVRRSIKRDEAREVGVC